MTLKVVADSGTPEWTRRQSIQVESGVYKTVYKGDIYARTGLKLGGELNINNGVSFKGSVGLGTDVSLKAEISKKIDLSKKNGLEIYGVAEYDKRLSGEPLYETGEKGNVTFVDQKNTKPIELAYDTTEKIRDGYKKVGIGAIFNYKKSNIGTVGFGVEAGYRTNQIPDDASNFFESDQGTYSGVQKSLNISKMFDKYLTLKFKAEMFLNKSKNCILNADMDMYGANVGLKYLF